MLLVGAGVAGYLFLKQTDPGAGRDRDLLLHALPTAPTLSGSYDVTNVESFAATRAGLKLDGGPEGPGCDDLNNLTTAHGTAGATEEATAADKSASFSFLTFAYANEAFATDAYALAAGEAFRQCFQSGLSAAAGADTFQLADSAPISPPAVGDQASAYQVDMTAGLESGTVSVTLPTRVLVFRSGRTVAIVIAIGRPDMAFPDEDLTAATAYLATGVAKVT